MRCPRCHAEMRTVEPVSMALVTVNIAPCIACGGRWFPSGELAKIEDVVDLRFVELRHIPVDAVQRVPSHVHSAQALLLWKRSRTRGKRTSSWTHADTATGYGSIEAN